MSKTRQPLTARQVAKILRVSSRTVLRMVDSGTLRPVLKVDGATGPYLFDPADVERLAKERAA